MSNSGIASIDPWGRVRYWESIEAFSYEAPTFYGPHGDKCPCGQGGNVADTYNKQAAALVCDGRSGDPALEKLLFTTFLKAFRIWQDRQKKYGRNNIAKWGALGVLMRGDDKTERLAQIYTKDKLESLDESILDSWLDKVNYALMGAMLHLGWWPREGEEAKVIDLGGI